MSHLLHLDCIGTAEVLQAKPADLFGWLHAHGWVFRRGGKGAWRARQEKLDAGLLIHKAVVVTVAGRRGAPSGAPVRRQILHTRVVRHPSRASKAADFITYGVQQ